MSLGTKIVRLEPGDWLGIGADVCLRVIRRRGTNVELQVLAPLEVEVTRHGKIAPLSLAPVRPPPKRQRPLFDQTPRPGQVTGNKP